VVKRAPRPEQERLRAALKAMEQDPFAGDVLPLKHERAAFRRRLGDWRLFFDADPTTHTIEVTDIERRTTTTYKKRR
jgi:mRNA-degrading endonuclease RelE of RelBE toxin-antitoxin system